MIEEDGSYCAPFERYVLTRGQPAGDSFEEKDKDRSVGFFKGCIRILDFNPLDDPNKPPPPPPEERAVEGGAAEGGAEGELLQPGGDHPAPSPAPLSDRGELAAGSEAGGASVARSEAGSETGSLVLSREETFSTVSQVRDHYNFKELLGEPKKYKVRCYVMRALGLAPMDEGWDGSPGKSDPYLRANLGKKTYDNQVRGRRKECKGKSACAEHVCPLPLESNRNCIFFLNSVAHHAWSGLCWGLCWGLRSSDS